MASKANLRTMQKLIFLVLGVALLVSFVSFTPENNQFSLIKNTKIINSRITGLSFDTLESDYSVSAITTKPVAGYIFQFDTAPAQNATVGVWANYTWFDTVCYCVINPLVYSGSDGSFASNLANMKYGYNCTAFNGTPFNQTKIAGSSCNADLNIGDTMWVEANGSTVIPSPQGDGISSTTTIASGTGLQWLPNTTLAQGPDLTAPNVTLVSPANGSTETSSYTITFQYNVSDDRGLDNCSLYINNTLNQTDFSPVNSATNSFNATLDNGDYSWFVTCYDNSSNPNSSDTWYFTLNVPNQAPTFVTATTDNSDANNPTNINTNVTFTTNATDPENDNYQLVICNSSTIYQNATCTDTEICSSSFVTSGTLATCQHNTSGETQQTYNWYSFVCDAENCSTYNNTNSPYNVNHYPTYTTIPTQSWQEDNNKTLNLSNYFTDPDSDDLNYTSTIPQNITVLIDNNTHIATFVPDNNWFGTQTISFTAYDPFGLSNTSNTFTLNVTSVNDAPTLTAINVSPTIGNNGTFITVTTVGAHDVENDNLLFFCGPGSGDWSSCTSNYGQPELTCNFTSNWTDDSIHTIYCVVYDTFLISAERTVNFTADNTAPTITNTTSDTPFPIYNNGSEQNISINFTSDEYPINVTFDLYNETGSIVDTVTIPVNSSGDLPVDYTIPDTLTDGNYTLNMTITDIAGNSNTTTLGNITVDSIPPTLTNITTDVTFPLYNNGTAQNITLNFTSDEYPIDITFNLYNETGDLISNYTYELNSSNDLPLVFTIPGGLPDGNYTLNITAEDLAHNDNIYTLGDVIVDTTPPTITNIATDIPFPVYNNGSEQNISINFTSDEYPINITFELYNETGSLIDTVIIPINTSGDLPIDYTIPGGLTEGNYTLNMTATDSAGNDAIYNLGDIIVDTTPPIISNITTDIPFPIYNNGSEQNISINFTSDEYPINVTFDLYNETGSIVDTVTIPVNSSGDLPVDYTIPDTLPDGNYTLNMTLTDLAGNENTTTLGTITVDSIPPTITNITSDTTFPIYNNGTTQNISINFTSDEYPINVTFDLYNETGSIVDTITIPVNSSGDLPLVYTIPSLPDGNYTLNMTATDQSGNDNTYNLGDIIVSSFVNTPPTVSTQAYTDYVGHIFSSEVNASDIDPQTLSCTLYHSQNSSYTPKPMVLIAGNNSNGTWAANISTSDGYSVFDTINTYASCNDTIDTANSTIDNHTITNYNPSAPVVDVTPDFASQNLDLYCTVTTNSTDADSDNITYYYDWYKNSTLNLSVGPLSQTTHILTSGNTTTNDEWNCTVTPYDGYVNGSSASDKVFIYSNTPPVFNESKNLPNITWPEDNNYTNYSLSEYFYDLDLDNLTYYYTPVENITVQINQTTGNVSFIPDLNFNGIRYIQFNVTDGLEWSNYSNNVTLNITPVDDPPYLISNIIYRAWARNTNLTIDLSQYFEEVDGETLTFTNTPIANVTVYYNGSIATLVPDPNFFGTRYVIFTANDSISTTDSDNATLNITATSPLPNSSKFDNKTNFTEWFETYYNLQSVTDMFLEITSYGKIQWHNPINAEYEDYDSYVDIGRDYVEVQSQYLDSSINSSATVWLYNLSFDVPFPVLMIKEGTIWRQCPESICTLISYENGTAIFNVTHFTAFALSSDPPVPYLRIPQHESTIIVRNPTFDWSDVEDPNPEDYVTHYLLQYSTDSSFPNNSSTTNVTVNASASSYSVPWIYYLDDNTTYWWRVQAYNDKGLGSGWQTVPFWFLVDTTAHNCSTDLLAHEVEGDVFNSDNVTPVLQNTLVKLEIIDGPNIGWEFYTTVDSDLVPNLEWGNGHYLVMDSPCFRTGDNFTMYAENGTHEGWNYNNTFVDGTTGAWGTGYVDIILNQTIPYPYKPTNVMAYPVNGGSLIYINWTPALYADFYNIYASENLTFVQTPIGVSYTNYFLDTNPTNYTERFYLVEAVRISYGNESDELVGKFNILVKDGLNLVSLPFLVDEWNLRHWNGSEFHNVTYPLVNNTANVDFNISKFFRRTASGFDPSLLWVDSPTYGEYWYSAEPTFYTLENDRGYYAEVDAVDNFTWYNWTVAGKVSEGIRNTSLNPNMTMVGFTIINDGGLRINNGSQVIIDPTTLFINNSAYSDYNITGIWWYNTSDFQFLDYIEILDSYYSSNAPNFTTIEPGKGYFMQIVTTDNLSKQFNYTTP